MDRTERFYKIDRLLRQHPFVRWRQSQAPMISFNPSMICASSSGDARPSLEPRRSTTPGSIWLLKSPKLPVLWLDLVGSDFDVPGVRCAPLAAS